MIVFFKPLKNYFNRVADKEAFFSKKRLAMAASASLLSYAVAAGCGYKMFQELSDEWRYSNFVSLNAVKEGGPWGIGMVAASYVGDVPLLYTFAGAVFWWRRRNTPPAHAPHPAE